MNKAPRLGVNFDIYIMKCALLFDYWQGWLIADKVAFLLLMIQPPKYGSKGFR